MALHASGTKKTSFNRFWGPLTGVTLFLATTLSHATSPLAPLAGPAGKLSVRAPKDWKIAEQQLGIDLVMQGPEKKGLRPVLSVLDTRSPKTKLDLANLQETEDEYLSERQQWVSRAGGVSLGKIPGRYRKLASGVEYYALGHRYILDSDADGENGNEFAETTYYLVCNSHFYYAKATLPMGTATDGEKTQNDVQSILESLQCK